MAYDKSLGQKVAEFQPSKTLWAWSCAACIGATIVAGFWLGGWVTGGTAQAMADKAAVASQAKLAAALCVERFSQAPDFAVKLAALKKESHWQRDDMIDKGGWTTFGKMEKPVKDAGSLCAEQLAALEDPAASTAAEATGTTTAVQ